jgi:hypothetical protein
MIPEFWIRALWKGVLSASREPVAKECKLATSQSKGLVACDLDINAHEIFTNCAGHIFSSIDVLLSTYLVITCQVNMAPIAGLAVNTHRLWSRGLWRIQGMHGLLAKFSDSILQAGLCTRSDWAG